MRSWRDRRGGRSGAVTPQGVELRHLRYFVALADAGTFTHAAEQMFIAQPTLSQQIRRLEEMVGTPLLQRGREGVQLTEAGSVLLEESRAVLSRVDHGVSRTRQAAGLAAATAVRHAAGPAREAGRGRGIAAAAAARPPVSMWPGSRSRWTEFFPFLRARQCRPGLADRGG